MNIELSAFAARLRETISSSVAAEVTRLKCLEPAAEIPNPINSEPPYVGCYEGFDALALELFALQFKHNSTYRKICEARKLTPRVVEHWTQIPAVPTSAFKELELSCIPPQERTVIFHSSGTTEQRPSRHFHCAESLAVYKASLWEHFQLSIFNRQLSKPDQLAMGNWRLAILTPPLAQAPHSSLVHMFEVVRQKLGAPDSAFVGQIGANGAWMLDFYAALAAIQCGGDSEERRNFQNAGSAALCRDAATPQILLGTAFSFVHLLDYMMERDLRVELPAGSRAMETGGYKNRSRSMPKSELHTLITERLGIRADHIICEYGMSELSSQAYDREIQNSKLKMQNSERQFRFPPWARAQIVSPETGREVADGETGLIRVFDLANVFSVAAIQTEDLGIRRGDGFELIGRAQLAEPRGCSLMTA